jgi:hypothetical protein
VVAQRGCGGSGKLLRMTKPYILRLLLGPLVKGRILAKGRRKFAVGTYFKRLDLPPYFFAFVFTPPPRAPSKSIFKIVNYDQNLSHSLTNTYLKAT